MKCQKSWINFRENLKERVFEKVSIKIIKKTKYKVNRNINVTKTKVNVR